MGSGTSGAVLVSPQDDRVQAPADDDQRLVTAIRRGDDRAFEVLYARYQRRIHAYVLGMVKDHGRAEDVTQEVFVSALRRMRETEQPLAVKAWLYQIAKNSCIDAFRRSKRTDEVSYDADGGLAPSDTVRLVETGPEPDAAVAVKQEIESLCGAFGGLSETHHEILVLRELEGLSYQEIGERMGMTRAAVESTLFRARRRLTEEFDDIVSGARCLRIQGIIVTAVQSRLGARDTRRLARHLAHCQGCRREALAAGLDRKLFARPPLRERIATRVAGFLPFPVLLRFRRGGDAAPPPSGRGANVAAHLPMLSDQLSSGWGKAVAGAAVLAAGVSAGVGVQRVATTSERPTPAHSQPAGAAAAKPATGAPATVRPALTLGGSGAAAATPKQHKTSRAQRDAGSPSAARRATSAGGGPVQPAASTPARGERSAATSKPTATTKRDTGLPNVKLPASTDNPVQQTADALKQAGGVVTETTGVIGSAITDTTGAAGQVTGNGVVPGAVNQAAGAATGAAGQAAAGATGAAAGTVGAPGQAAAGAVGAAGQAAAGATGAPGGLGG